MKQPISLFVAVIALALAGCTMEPFSQEEGNEITIKATLAENNATKTVIQDGSTFVLWEPGDEVKVFYKTTGSRFTSNITEPAGVADFTGNLTITGFFGEGFTADTPLWAVYPYRADAVSDGESVTTLLPSAQTGRAGSFAKGTNITLAKSTNTTMGFYNVCGGIRFTLTKEGIKEVVFQGQDNEDIAGKVKLGFVDGIPTVQEVTEGQKAITLSAPYGQTFETGKWYYIVALPGTLSRGFKMTFNTATQYASFTSSDSRAIKRGIFGSLSNADENLVFKDKEGEEPQTGNIVFADLAAKYACVAKFDTDGDGEVSYEEAEAATSFSGLFDDWKGVVSFDEIRYFKNVHSLSGVFRGCNKLISITIPENINDLGTYAFGECSSLTSVILPSGITAIGDNSFVFCRSLSSIEIPSTVTRIGRLAFYQCDSLTSAILLPGITTIGDCAFMNCFSLSSIDIPSTVTSIGENAFLACNSLASIALPPQLKTIGKSAFSDCSSLSEIVIPNGVTSIPNGCFSGCSSLTSVSIPFGVTSIGEYAFDSVTMWKLELPSSISSLGGFCFGDIACIILPSESLVTIQRGTFNSVKGVFVPSNLIDMYGVMTNWANYSSKLHPIGTYKDRDEFTLITSGAVDMGTSVKWAAYNLGASRPEECGDYYAWGETQTKSHYDWSMYKWYSGNYITFTKYCPENKDGNWDGSGTPDGKVVLDLSDDAAHFNLGDSWRIPTVEEWEELLNDSWLEWTTYEGINGYKIYALGVGRIIFLPAAGHVGAASLFGVDSDGRYWSSSLFADNPCTAMDVFCDPLYIGVTNCDRYFGLTIRPVCD